jgi:8-oxo-dGTP pyrophosphatase MutT (NUDIX family)
MPTSPFTRAVRDALTELRPADELEARHRERCLALLEADPDPRSRHAFEPGHFTASAFVVDPSHERVLLIHHRKLGRWLQPGGHIEVEDADFLAAARREVREEVGLDALEPVQPGIFDVDVHRIPPLGDEPGHEHFDLRVLLRARTEHFSAGAEVNDARWFEFSRVSVAESDESVVRAVRKLTPTC